MAIVVSLFALAFLAVGLLLVWLGVSSLAARLRAAGRWVRVTGRIVEIVEERRVVTRTTRYAAGDSSGRLPDGQATQLFHFPVYEYCVPGARPAKVRSALASEDPGAYALGDTAELLVDPLGKVEPLVNARGGVWFMPFGMLAAGLVALACTAGLAFMVARGVSVPA